MWNKYILESSILRFWPSVRVKIHIMWLLLCGFPGGEKSSGGVWGICGIIWDQRKKRSENLCSWWYCECNQRSATGTSWLKSVMRRSYITVLPVFSFSTWLVWTKGKTWVICSQSVELDYLGILTENNYGIISGWLSREIVQCLHFSGIVSFQCINKICPLWGTCSEQSIIT